MRAVEVNMVSTDDKAVGFTVNVEKNVAGTWRQETPIEVVVSGEPEAQRRVLLEANERIVITAAGADVELVWDPVNMATMPREAYESQPTDAEKQATEAKRQEELRHGRHSSIRANAAADEAAARARDRVLEEQRKRDAEKADAAKKDAEKAKAATDDASKSESTRSSTTPPSPPKPPAAAMTTPRPQPSVPPRSTTPAQPTGQTQTQPSGAGGGMTAPGPSTAGASSKDVKNG